MLNGKPYENLFRYAANDVSKQTKHPGQSLPGAWNIGGDRPANVIIVAIVASALARVAKQHKVDFQALLARYTELAVEVPFQAIGAPDKIAERHLQDVSRLAADLRTTASADARLAAADMAMA